MDLKQFVGRKKEIAILKDWFVNAESSKCLFISGANGVGKTVLKDKVLDELASDNSSEIITLKKKYSKKNRETYCVQYAYTVPENVNDVEKTVRDFWKNFLEEFPTISHLEESGYKFRRGEDKKEYLVEKDKVIISKTLTKNLYEKLKNPAEKMLKDPVSYVKELIKAYNALHVDVVLIIDEIDKIDAFSAEAKKEIVSGIQKIYKNNTNVRMLFVSRIPWDKLSGLKMNAGEVVSVRLDGFNLSELGAYIKLQTGLLVKKGKSVENECFEKSNALLYCGTHPESWGTLFRNIKYFEGEITEEILNGFLNEKNDFRNNLIAIVARMYDLLKNDRLKHNKEKTCLQSYCDIFSGNTEINKQDLEQLYISGYIMKLDLSFKEQKILDNEVWSEFGVRDEENNTFIYMPLSYYIAKEIIAKYNREAFGVAVVGPDAQQVEDVAFDEKEDSNLGKVILGLEKLAQGMIILHKDQKEARAEIAASRESIENILDEMKVKLEEKTREILETIELNVSPDAASFEEQIKERTEQLENELLAAHADKETIQKEKELLEEKLNAQADKWEEVLLERYSEIFKAPLDPNEIYKLYSSLGGNTSDNITKAEIEKVLQLLPVYKELETRFKMAFFIHKLFVDMTQVGIGTADYSILIFLYARMYETFLKRMHYRMYQVKLSNVNTDVWDKSLGRKVTYGEIEYTDLTLGKFCYLSSSDKGDLKRQIEYTADDWDTHFRCMKSITDIRNDAAHEGTANSETETDYRANLRKLLREIFKEDALVHIAKIRDAFELSALTTAKNNILKTALETAEKICENSFGVETKNYVVTNTTVRKYGYNGRFSTWTSMMRSGSGTNELRRYVQTYKHPTDTEKPNFRVVVAIGNEQSSEENYKIGLFIAGTKVMELKYAHRDDLRASVEAELKKHWEEYVGQENSVAGEDNTEGAIEGNSEAEANDSTVDSTTQELKVGDIVTFVYEKKVQDTNYFKGKFMQNGEEVLVGVYKKQKGLNTTKGKETEAKIKEITRLGDKRVYLLGDMKKTR